MKSLNKSFISKRKKRKLLVFSSSLFSMFAIGLGLSLTSSLSLNKDSITSVNSNLNALKNTTTSTQSAANFTVNAAQTPLNKKANEVTNSDIQNILTPSATVSSYNVVILPVTETNINKGYVNFLVYQTYWDGSLMKTEFADASKSMNTANGGTQTNYQSDDTYDSAVLNEYGFTSERATTNPSTTNIFSTAKINNLANWITAEKYNIEWKSDEELKTYITNSTATTLTTEMLVNNFFSNTTNLPNLATSGSTNANNQPSSTTITVTSVDKNGNTANDSNSVGLFKIEIQINQTSKSNWLNDNFPTGSTGGESANGNDDKKTITITKYIGGFNTASGQRYIVDIDSELQTIRNWTISDTSLFDGASTENNTVSSLRPSQFESPYGGKTALISLFSTGTGLYSTGNTVTPIVQYSFTDSTNTKYNFHDPSASNNNGSNGTQGSGLIQEINNQRENIKITDITTIANDVDGSLRIIIKYDGFSIYSGTVVSQTKTYDYVAGTFATSSQPENLFFSWKDVNTLSAYGLNTPSDIVNQFMRNNSNTEFVRVFTNQFINASSEIQALNRTATILFGTATGEDALPETNNSLNDQTGLYSPGNSVSGRSITVRLTFDNWNGTTQQKVFQQSFTFSGVSDTGTYSYSTTGNTTGYDDSLVLTWRSNDAVLTNNPSFASTTPSTVVYNIMTSGTSTSYYETFASTNNNASEISVSFEANDVDGSLIVFLTKTSTSTDANIKTQNAHIYSQLFTGFRKTTETTGVVSFSWIPNEEVSGALQSIPVNNVTKEDIIEHYLSNSALFQNGDLGTADITLTPNINENSLTIEVTMSFFNQDNVTTTNRTFATKLTGFATYQYTNSSSFTPPKNMTAVFAISAATVLSITLGVVLLAMLLKRARLRNFKSYHDSVLEKKVKKHTRRTIK